MSNYIAADTDLAAIADAIRTKGGTSDPLTFPGGFEDAIADIQSGGGVGDLITVASDCSLAKDSIVALYSAYQPVSSNWYVVGRLTNKAVADYVDYQLLAFFYRYGSSSWGCFARYRTEGSSIGYNHQSQIGNTSRGDIAVGDEYLIFPPAYLG